MMKKLMILALAIALALAFTVPAMAETKVKFKGNWRVRGNWFDNYYYNDNNEVKRSYFDHRLQFNVDFMPSDAITMHVRTTALKDQMWGHQRSNLEWSGKSGAPGATANNAGTLNANIGGRDYSGSLEVYQAWMDIKSAYGTFSVGRMPSGVGGLAGLGHSFSVMGDFLPFDAGAERDRIKWVWSSGPLTLLALYQKTAERDADIDQNPGYAEDNLDAEYWCFSPKYMWDTGGASIGLNYSTNDADPNNELSYFWLTPALRLVFGQFEVDFEGGFGWGEVGDVDLEGVRFYLDAGYTYGPGKVGIAYMYAQGDDPDSAAIEGYGSGVGGDYGPLWGTYWGWWGNTLVEANNHWSVVLFWQHNITEDLMLHAAYGFAGINETAAGVDDDYGSEFNLGLQYYIMKNLRYRAYLAYFIPGSFLDDVLGYDTDNALAFRHELRLDF